MKNGTLIIIEKDGRWIAVIRRQNAPDIELNWLELTDTIRAYGGKTCQYRGNNVIIGGINYFKPEGIKNIVAPVEPIKSISQLMRESANDTPSVSNDEDMEISEREHVGDDSFSLKGEYARVPKDTRESGWKENCDNFHLKFYRFARFDFKDAKKSDKHFKFFNAKDITPKGEARLVPPLEIRANFGKLPIEPIDKNGIEQFNISKRQKQSVESVFIPKQIVQTVFKPAWRMVVGLGGGESVYEVGMTLHHIYGIPYIPASSIKGVLRSYIIQQKFNNSESVALKGETDDSKSFIEIFGTTANQGNITFFDAFPTTEPKLRPDIMNPHYPDYYSGSKAPTDTQNLIPIPFLVVYNTSFQFLLASKKMDIQQELWEFEENNEKKRLTLAQWLKKSLSEHGIGAKTAVGYGYMKQ